MGEEGGHGGRAKERGKGFQRQMRGSGDDPRPTRKADRQGTCFYALFFNLLSEILQNILDILSGNIRPDLKFLIDKTLTSLPAVLKYAKKRQVQHFLKLPS